MTIRFITRCLALAAGVCVSTAGVLAQDSGPLLDLLVRKGIVTDQEAEELRAELTKDFASTPAGKMNLSSSLTELRLGGDLRVRYEDRSGELASGDEQERGRFRYRLRTALAGRLRDNWAFGLRLETSSSSRSTNVTMGDDGGPFAKNSDGLHVGQVYAQWLPTREWTLTAGRMPNPFVSTSMVWDGDINPEGFAERFVRRGEKFEYSFTAGQFLYSAASTQNAFGTAPEVDDLFLLGWQAGLKYSPDSSGRYFQISPTLYHYVQNNSQNPAAFSGTFTATSTRAVNNLTVFNVPMEYGWSINDVPARVFADFAINLDGDDRARKWGRPDLDDEDTAYQFGFQYGKAAQAGEWDARIFYQSIGAFALDPNLVDSDLFDSRTNMEGLVFSGNYALGAATQFALTAARGERKHDGIVAAGSGDIGSNNTLDKYWLLQLDLNVKF